MNGSEDSKAGGIWSKGSSCGFRQILPTRGLGMGEGCVVPGRILRAPGKSLEPEATGAETHSVLSVVLSFIEVWLITRL